MILKFWMVRAVESAAAVQLIPVEEYHTSGSGASLYPEPMTWVVARVAPEPVPGVMMAVGLTPDMVDIV